MANLTAPRADGRQEGVLIDVPYGDNTIYAGAAVTVDDDGNAAPGVPAKPFLGVAMEGSQSGKDFIRVWAEGVFDFNTTGAAAADLGATVILVDDNTVAKGTTGTIIGKIVEVTSATVVRVKI